MTDTFWMNLAGILGGGALVITALTGLVNTWYAVRTHHTLAETKAAVNDGTKEMQRMVGDLAKQAVGAATAPRAVRATDLLPVVPLVVEEPKPDVP